MAPPVPSRRAAAALAFVLALAAPLTAGAQGEAYKQHMDNGVKLYADHNFAAAVVEFQAAYEARPSPNPLVNIALCAKEMFRYPQAIAALEAAVEKHGDVMDPVDRRAAVDAIKEMRGLLGTIRVSVTPPEATLTVDGEDQAVAAARGPILLGPGTHKIAARAEGYATAEQTVSVASGREQVVTLALVAEKGPVTIDAPDARTTVVVDERPVGQGHWSGMLAPGPHLVQMYGADGQPYAMQILVTAGVPLYVRKGLGGIPISPPKKEDPRRGFYVLGLGSMLFPATHPQAFGSVKQDYGAGYGLRAGFQVNKIAGFELTYEHSSISTYSIYSDNSNYRIIADRVVVGLRLISSGKLLRFAGSFGGGFVNDQMAISLAPSLMCAANSTAGACFLAGNHVGIDAFALAEAGLELDLDHVILDFGAEGQVQSTGNLSGVNRQSIFGTQPLINGGPAIRIGYRFW